MAVLPRPSLIRNPINTKLAPSFAMIPAARDSLCGLWEDGRELNGAEAAGGRPRDGGGVASVGLCEC